MELVIDANILIAALLKAGITRKIMLHAGLILYSSEFILEEFFKHIDTIAKKAEISKEEIQNITELLIAESHLKIVTKDEA